MGIHGVVVGVAQSLPDAGLAVPQPHPLASGCVLWDRGVGTGLSDGCTYVQGDVEGYEVLRKDVMRRERL